MPNQYEEACNILPANALELYDDKFSFPDSSWLYFLMDYHTEWKLLSICGFRYQAEVLAKYHTTMLKNTVAIIAMERGQAEPYATIDYFANGEELPKVTEE